MTSLDTILGQEDEKSSHWDRRREAISLQIEKDALQLFLERGPDNVTSDEIAEAAGVSRRTLFRYFESRDDILSAQPYRAMAFGMQFVKKRPANETMREALVAVAKQSENWEFEQELMKLMTGIMVNTPDPWMRAMLRRRSDMEALLGDMAACRLQISDANDPRITVIAAVLSAISRQTYLNWARNGCRGSYASKLDEALRAVDLIGHTP